MGGPAIGLDCRSRSIEGQVQHGQRAFQLLLPVGPMALPDRASEHISLPAHKVGVVHYRGWKRSRWASSFGSIEQAEFIDEHVQRPEVDSDVVDGQREDVILGGSLEHLDAQYRSSFQVKRVITFFEESLIQLLPTPG